MSWPPRGLLTRWLFDWSVHAQDFSCPRPGYEPAVLSGLERTATADRVHSDMSIPGTHTRTDSGVSQEQIIESVQKRYNAKVVRVTETQCRWPPGSEIAIAVGAAGLERGC